MCLSVCMFVIPSRNNTERNRDWFYLGKGGWIGTGYFLRAQGASDRLLNDKSDWNFTVMDNFRPSRGIRCQPSLKPKSNHRWVLLSLTYIRQILTHFSQLCCLPLRWVLHFPFLLRSSRSIGKVFLTLLIIF